MVININLPENFPGEKLVIRLVDTVEKGIGSLLEPWQIKRVGKANLENDRNRLLMLAKAEADIELFKQGKATVDPRTYQVIPKITNEEGSGDNYINKALSNQVIKTISKEINISKAILYAAKILMNDNSEPPEKTVDQDLLNQWAEYAGLVSDEQLQELWGKILAGEVKAPGKYSLRTLTFVKNISKKDAEEIYGVSSFVIKDFIFKNPNREKTNLSFASLLHLQELGVIQGVESMGINQTFDSSYPDRFELVTNFGNMLFIIKSPKNNKVLSLPAYAITSLGKEVFSLINDVKTDETYLIELAKYIVSQGFEVKISLKWAHLPDGRVNFEATDVTLN